MKVDGVEQFPQKPCEKCGSENIKLNNTQILCGSCGHVGSTITLTGGRGGDATPGRIIFTA